MLSCLDFVFPVEPDRISSSANSAIAYLVAICTTLYVSVRARELMPALAVCFSCVHCSRSKPTKQINLACYCLQMIRVNTGSHSAKMIYLVSLWNFMAKIFERMAVCTYRFVNEGEVAITTTIATGGPVPASFSEFNVFKKRGFSISLGHVFYYTNFFNVVK